MRIEFDRARRVVNLMFGNECVDQLPLDDFFREFGAAATAAVLWEACQ